MALSFLLPVIHLSKGVLKAIVAIGFLNTIAKLLVLQSFSKYISLLPQGFDFNILQSLGFFICKFNSILCVIVLLH
jgi:hypothetical protein